MIETHLHMIMISSTIYPSSFYNYLFPIYAFPLNHIIFIKQKLTFIIPFLKTWCAILISCVCSRSNTFKHYLLRRHIPWVKDKYLSYFYNMFLKVTTPALREKIKCRTLFVPLMPIFSKCGRHFKFSALKL
jgi:hypothetical protein